MNIRAKHFLTALAIACRCGVFPARRTAAAAGSGAAAPAAGSARTSAPPPAASEARRWHPEGNAAAGTPTLTAEADGVCITGSLAGVAPGGTHGFHVHETGDCSAPMPPRRPALQSATIRTAIGPGEHHAGDMPNLAG